MNTADSRDPHLTFVVEAYENTQWNIEVIPRNLGCVVIARELFDPPNLPGRIFFGETDWPDPSLSDEAKADHFFKCATTQSPSRKGILEIFGLVDSGTPSAGDVRLFPDAIAATLDRRTDTSSQDNSDA